VTDHSEHRDPEWVDPERPQLDYDFHSDPDGDRFLHTDDPTSVDWVVEIVGNRVGDDTRRETAERCESRIAFPAIGWHMPLSAWFVDRDYCHLEVTDAHGTRHRLGTCPHAASRTPSRLRGTNWDTAAPAGKGLRCSRCGKDPDWLVTRPHERGAAPAPGRLLVYCDSCRTESAEHLATVLPLAMLRLDPTSILTLLYRSGATHSEPQMVADMLGLPPSTWLEAAEAAVARATND
jgi:hypothetical protein